MTFSVAGSWSQVTLEVVDHVEGGGLDQVAGDSTLEQSSGRRSQSKVVASAIGFRWPESADA